MKKLIAIILAIVLTLSLAGLVVFYFHHKTVTGGEAPVIAFDTDVLEVSTAAADAELLRGVTATDAEDGDVTDTLIVESVSRFVAENTVNVTYAAFDTQNHVTKAQRRVRYTDYTPPRFTLSAPLVFTESGAADLLSAVGATDAVDGDLTGRVKVSGKDGGSLVSSVGSHAVEFRVTNSKGDTVYLPATVDVVTGNANPARITLSSYLVYLPQGAEFAAADYLQSYERGGETRTDAAGLHIESDVDPVTPGVYTVTYSTDSGNTSSYTRLIVVIE